ncbi:hypothetical protein CEP52_007427 [Fusarium oligoseptatum]|uniref:Uncharacterized protein n=1 Tax=Fusarium oligoseptatum TaxID=2604345 RepID=A0A428TMV7_9HYPO|nr:hypothetical protein CEP52_007427 [Fusarium oligoseptatum]
MSLRPRLPTDRPTNTPQTPDCRHDTIGISAKSRDVMEGPSLNLLSRVHDGQMSIGRSTKMDIQKGDLRCFVLRWIMVSTLIIDT